MGLFSRKKTPEQIGVELASRLKKSVATIPATLSLFQGGELFTLDDVDRRRLVWEAIVLTYIGQRLAVQLIYKKGVERNVEARKRICNALDSSASTFLDSSADFDELLDQRGEQYFQLVRAHAPGSKAFLEALQFKFEQFCRTGEHQDDRVIAIGSFRSMMPLRILAVDCWSAGFVETARYVADQLG